MDALGSTLHVCRPESWKNLHSVRLTSPRAAEASGGGASPSSCSPWAKPQNSPRSQFPSSLGPGPPATQPLTPELITAWRSVAPRWLLLAGARLLEEPLGVGAPAGGGQAAGLCDRRTFCRNAMAWAHPPLVDRGGGGSPGSGPTSRRRVAWEYAPKAAPKARIRRKLMPCARNLPRKPALRVPTEPFCSRHPYLRPSSSPGRRLWSEFQGDPFAGARAGRRRSPGRHPNEMARSWPRRKLANCDISTPKYRVRMYRNSRGLCSSGKKHCSPQTTKQQQHRY